MPWRPRMAESGLDPTGEVPGGCGWYERECVTRMKHFRVTGPAGQQVVPAAA